MAVAFAKAGASYIAIGARSDLSSTEKAIQNAISALRKRQPRLLPLKLDVTSIESVENAAAAVRKDFGRIDIIINNAGVLIRGKIVKAKIWVNSVLYCNVLRANYLLRGFLVV